ncbi:hypothetical protein P1X14_16330 [Sphingomonas sp. AOB5]|uniref:hypothetical protein n=1 Tax=Sphingomonas sp. AOB5 TaxID=3034017 RepID=UPI0023F9CC15|nr:hypothetical protein [Sphingomonas sp. AOB5]MDF7776825.1 hypothetical protein [Sphingomonas sp. AOB5]
MSGQGVLWLFALVVALYGALAQRRLWLHYVVLALAAGALTWFMPDMDGIESGFIAFIAFFVILAVPFAVGRLIGHFVRRFRDAA